MSAPLVAGYAQASARIHAAFTALPSEDRAQVALRGPFSDVLDEPGEVQFVVGKVVDGVVEALAARGCDALSDDQRAVVIGGTYHAVLTGLLTERSE